MSELIQVSKNVWVDLNHYKLECREKMRYNLSKPPTHDYCNSNCDDCKARKYCRWAPWNIGTLKGRKEPFQTKREIALDRRFKTIKCIDGKRKYYDQKKLAKVPGKWLWRKFCESPMYPCYHAGGCFPCVANRYPNQEIFWSNKQQAYVLHTSPVSHYSVTENGTQKVMLMECRK